MTVKQQFLRSLFRAVGQRWSYAEFGGVAKRGDITERDLTEGLALLAADRALASVLRDQEIDLVIDVGANVGQFARRVRKAGYRGRIISYEPSLEPLTELAQVAASDGNMTVRNVGVAAERGELTFTIFADSQFNSANARAAGLGGLYADRMQISEQASIPVVRLDEEQEHIGSARNILLKSDTQGLDLEVFKGAEGLLSRVRAAHVELPFFSIYESAPTASTIVPFLADYGLSLAWIVPIAFRKDVTSAPIVECDGLFVRT